MPKREYQVPLMFDVTADSVEDATDCIVGVLANVNPRVVGATFPGLEAMVESWWTLEKIAKPYDRNDNDHGVVVFQDDLDYLFDVLVRVSYLPGSGEADEARHDRLVSYFDPNGRRCGADHG